MDSMGSFDHEKNILKRYARRGQCFSTTKKVLQLEEADVNQNFPDVQRNGFVFSDGCGFISPGLAQLIADRYSVTQISAMQIRLGGAKGVLSITNNPEIFKKDDDNSY